jgi:hypothetical protein
MKGILWMSLLLLTGCGLLPTGDDQTAQEYTAIASTVLVAANKYTVETGAPPKSLRQLIPKYLRSMPRDLDVRYNAFTTTLYFDYATGLMRMEQVTCSAKIGEEQWFCE